MSFKPGSTDCILTNEWTCCVQNVLNALVVAGTPFRYY